MSKFISKSFHSRMVKHASCQIFTSSKFYKSDIPHPPSSIRRNRSKSRAFKNPNFGKNFISGIVKIPRIQQQQPPTIINPILVDEIRNEIKLKRIKAAFTLPKLNQEDCKKRVEFSELFLKRLELEPGILDSLFFSDEGNFWPLNPLANHKLIQSRKQRKAKNKLYAESDPLPCLVWCAMNTKEVIGPYFFNSYVTDRSYMKMLEKYFLKELQLRGYDLGTVWYQQDGAPPHRSNRSIEFLQKKFDARLISYGVPPYTWPPRSQDLTPLDYFLWDYLKIRMVPFNPTSHENLRDCLAFEIQNIDQSLLQSEVMDFKSRLTKCLNANGNRFEDI